MVCITVFLYFKFLVFISLHLGADSDVSIDHSNVVFVKSIMFLTVRHIKRPFFGAADLLEKAFVKTRRDYVPQTKILFNIYV